MPTVDADAHVIEKRSYLGLSGGREPTLPPGADFGVLMPLHRQTARRAARLTHQSSIP